LEEKKAAIATFTIDSLKKIRQTGARIGMVSVGNETTGYMAGEQGIEKISGLIAAGAAAVRAFDADILIAVHFTNTEYNDYDAFAAQLQAAGADYDIFATSYYPTYHGTTQNLIAKMSRVAQAYGKLTMIAEYNYPVDGSVDAGVQMVFGKSDEAGQVQAICTVNQTAAQMAQGIGTFYWEPAWVQAPAQTWATQGSGWYNAPAAEYDLANASISGAQGSATSENALFDWSGRPRKAIQEKIFEQIRKVSP
jgi:arabinogalactan endo-1,4-beta-galactosidase